MFHYICILVFIKYKYIFKYNIPSDVFIPLWYFFSSAVSALVKVTLDFSLWFLHIPFLHVYCPWVNLVCTIRILPSLCAMNLQNSARMSYVFLLCLINCIEAAVLRECSHYQFWILYLRLFLLLSFHFGCVNRVYFR